MSHQSTGAIVCMVRGGGAGRRVQEKAIDLALKSQLRLIFLHVIDLQMLSLEKESLLEPARMEMAWFGSVTLNLARKLALASGVEAETQVRYGRVFDVAVEYLKENPAELVLLGAPHPLLNDYEARLNSVHQFAARIQQATGVKAEVITMDNRGLRMMSR